MSDEKFPVRVYDLQRLAARVGPTNRERKVLAMFERRHGPTRWVLMTRDEFVREVRKVTQRLGEVQKLLAARGGLTNRERRALDKEQRLLARWLRNETSHVIVRNPSWASALGLKIVKLSSGARSSKARRKKQLWLARKHPSWVSS